MLKSAIAIGFVTVCATAQCNAQTRPLTEVEKRVISSAYGANLKDPESARYEWAEVSITDNLKPGRVGVCFRVNARNSFGGYVGYKLIFGVAGRLNDEIVAFGYVRGQDDDSPAVAVITAEMCRTFGVHF